MAQRTRDTNAPMANENVPLSAYAPSTARDMINWSLFPTGFSDRYEVFSYRNALQVLAGSCPNEFGELISTLNGFTIATEDIARGGGNKSRIAKGVETLFHPLGWRETSVSADLLITRTIHTDPGKRGQNAPRDYIRNKIVGFVAGHKIDFVKGRVAFDLEWNSKDQTFDRDLYAMRSFYETGIISAGVLLTRSAELVPLFSEMKARQPGKVKATKFGASTTWMKKLVDRLDAGRAGGCPILAIGMKPALITDFDVWKQQNPLQQRVESIMVDVADEEDDED